MSDEKYMRRCLELASMGIGFVAPNPMVGAVLVYQQKIIGEGFHRFYGGPHAEVECMNSVKEENKALVSKATLYVSLEPCTHYGKTPPCVQLVLRHKIPKVVIASLDCNEVVRGKGVALMKENGVEVEIGCLDAEQQLLNKRFYTFHEKKRPFILLKWAESADGFMGKPGERIKITSEIQDIAVHKRRSEEQAIMVGTNTIQIDNPFLNVRLWSGRQPIRIIIDRKLAIPPDANVYRKEGEVIVLNEIQDHISDNATFIKMYSFSPEKIIEVLYTLGIQSVMIEGGAKLIKSFIDKDLFDEVLVFKGITNLGSGIKSPAV